MTVYRLALIILVTRPWFDLVLSQASVNLGGRAISIGALVNVLVILAGIAMCFRENRLLVPRVFIWIWMPFLTAALFGLLYSPQEFVALRTFLVYVSYACMFILGYQLSHFLKDERTLVHALMISAVIPILGTPIQLAFDYAGGVPRASSVFSHPNILAFYCMVLCAYFFHIWNTDVFQSRMWRNLLFATMLALAVCLLLSGTRSAWLSMYVFGLLYTIQTRPRFVPIVLMAPLLALAIPSVYERVAEVVTATNSGLDLDYVAAVAQGRIAGSETISLNSYEWRELLWQGAFGWIEKQPVLGYGLESFGYHVPQFFPLSVGAAGAHNIYVQFIFELGAVGLAAYAWLMVASLSRFWSAKSAPRADRALCISLFVAYHVAAYSDNMMYYLSVNWLFWFLIGRYLMTMQRAAFAAPRQAAFANAPERESPGQSPQLPR